MKVSDLLESDAGFLVRDTMVFICEILDCCPWFDFSDLEVRLNSGTTLSTVTKWGLVAYYDAYKTIKCNVLQI